MSKTRDDNFNAVGIFAGGAAKGLERLEELVPSESDGEWVDAVAISHPVMQRHVQRSQI